MGLDTVELVMEFEDEFEIAIPDEDAEKIQTLRDTFNYVMRRFADRPPTGPCSSAREFYRLRSELQETCGIARRAVRPDSRIGELMPTDEMRVKWKGIARRMRLPVPRFDVFHPFAVRFPPPQSRIRDLIHASGPPSYLRPNGAVDADTVWRRIKEIVAEQADVSIDELQPDTHYYRDLF